MIRTPSASDSVFKFESRYSINQGCLGELPLPSARQEEIKVPDGVSNNVRKSAVQTGVARSEHGSFPFHRVG